MLQNANNEEYFIVEPNIEEHKVFKLTQYQEAFENADIVAFLVAHKEFKGLVKNADKIILDFCGIFSDRV